MIVAYSLIMISLTLLPDGPPWLTRAKASHKPSSPPAMRASPSQTA